METQSFEVKGMHCASCSNIIHNTLTKLPGVASAEVSYGTEKAKITFDSALTNPKTMSNKLKPLGYELYLPKPQLTSHSPNEHAAHLGVNQSKQDKLSELLNLRNLLYSAIPLAIFSILVMGWDSLAKFQILPMQNPTIRELFHHLLPIFATYILFVVGKPYLQGLYRFLRFGKANMDTLIGLGTVMAFLYSFLVTAFETSLASYLDTEHTYYDVTIVVITFITLGKFLEAKAKLKTGDAIEKLLNLQTKDAIVIKDGQEITVPVAEVVIGDIIKIKPGASLPVDGVLLQGSSYLDEAMITGESMPVKKSPGDPVVAGTLNTTGSFTFKATKIGNDTLLAKIIQMVENAQGSRAPIQSLADSISAVFVPTVLVLAFVTLIAWILIGTSSLGFSQALTFGLTSFVGILVIACPCALGLATPTAIIVGVGKGAKEGILIKDAATLQKLHKVNCVVLDKTGTITLGKPEFIRYSNLSGMQDTEILSILSGLESFSEHPIAKAVLSYTQLNNIQAAEITDFESIKGKGLMGKVKQVKYFVGNLALLADLQISFDTQQIEKDTLAGKTPIFLTTENQILAYGLVADSVKPEAKKAISDLHMLGIKTIMLSGDHINTAKAIADEVGIDEVYAEVLPQDKLVKIQEFQSQKFIVAMAGDGVNDAPALAQADVGIAMATGTEVAMETAGITLLHGDITKLVKAIKLSKITMRGIKQNLFWAFIYNIVGIPLAAGFFYPFFGWLLNPIFAGLAMALSSVSVVLNSLRIKTKSI